MAQAEIMCPFWLVFECSDRPLTFHISGAGEVLPVFSFIEEADLFLRLIAEGGSLHADKVTNKELLSLVSGPCVGVERIALDPPGKTEALARLLSVSPQRFTRLLRERAETYVAALASA